MNYNILIKRKENRLYQKDVAKKLGLSKQSYYEKENGISEFKMSEALKLAKLYDCTLDELFGNKEVTHV